MDILWLLARVVVVQQQGYRNLDLTSWTRRLGEATVRPLSELCQAPRHPLPGAASADIDKPRKVGCAFPALASRGLSRGQGFALSAYCRTQAAGTCPRNLPRRRHAVHDSYRNS